MEKLILLLNQIKIDNSLLNYFKEGKLDKIVGNKDKTCYHFFIALKNTLPLEVYIKFLDCLKNNFKDYKVGVSFKVENKKNEYINDYYNYLLKQNLKEFPLLETFITDNLDINDNTINIKVANKAEKMKFKSIEVKLIDLLNSVGFDDINVNITIDEEKSKEIRKEIKA